VKFSRQRRGQPASLTGREENLLESIAGRIIPTTDTPGAVEAGAALYVNRSLAKAYHNFLPLYRKGLRTLNRAARARYGRPFPSLEPEKQDLILSDFEAGRVEGFPKSGEFFEAVRRHILEGVFGEPSYGGNQNLIGWRLVGFPGQQYGYADSYINRVVDLEPIAQSHDGEGDD
jgi:gluconate 2-dehydrogenase gamma chain